MLAAAISYATGPETWSRRPSAANRKLRAAASHFLPPSDQIVQVWLNRKIAMADTMLWCRELPRTTGS